MKRRDFSTLLATTPVLAASGTALAQGGPVEGRQYLTLGQPLPTTPGKVEVIEFFWYGCPHCYAFEPAIEAWARQLPPDVAFRKVHVAFRANVKIHQRMFYALEAMGKEAQARPAIFNAMHQQGQALDDPKSQAKFLSSLGIDPAKYQEAYNSFGVVTKCSQAEKLSEAYRIDGVPSIGVGGRFLTSPSQAAAGQRMTEIELGQKALQVTDFLIQRARAKA
ncbi:thiol:disulfide interchange protein DsbA/DsbL [Roseateles saccharophilus]|uniref:Thiol:disulfide interchange protein DsbA n=1 Tax=Roseateles saccharophilus TaxID=304 RepID=A0A4R3VMH3_ROSSA|nr:thiol:disulfide interchange protein DsbA/DsbL [Roseateles saccharophilus]MDG0831234.1 thiol:disulfide interchange protein DsbA/DsbL [Roseateles saccharophilus]TCV04355.1 thiol:disulfide interchange protein DsbA [Roseateles saccharophilus]